jgi:RNA polymerase sigma-54 factor
MDISMQMFSGLKQEQNLSAQALQSVQLLQMTTGELEATIAKELEENPLLEMDESAEDGGPIEPVEQTENPETENSLKEVGEEVYSKEDWDDLFDSSFVDTERPLKDLNAFDPEKEEWKNQRKSVSSMQDKLKEQLRDWDRPKEVLELVEYLIDSLDEKGYLTPSALEDEEKKEHSAIAENFLEAERVIEGKVALEEASELVQEAFHVLHSLTPRGIGARNLRECLLIQAYAVPEFPKLAIKILEDEFDNLVQFKYQQIAKALDVHVEDVQKAIQHYSELSPHPGFLINETPVSYIMPDLEILEESPGVYKASLLRSAKFYHRLKISNTYKSYLKESPTKEVKDFIRERLNKANNLIHCVGYRESTIERVMQKIIEFQPDFFAKGPTFLRPMMLQEVADALELNLSSVSRVVNGKYVETKYGVFELRSFFSLAVKQEGEEDLGVKQILHELKELIDAEDKKNPLSDQALSEALAEKGIKIARRTVAKYRENNLKILPARLRKLMKS